MKSITASFPKALVCHALAAFAVCASSSTLSAAWVTLQLPNLTETFGSYQSANLSDGRFVFGTTNQLDTQNTFGSSALTSFSNAQTWDPSSVAVQSNTLGAIGVGTFAPSGIYTFDPSNPSSAFTAIPGLSIQNYHMEFRDSSSLFVVGANGSQPGLFSQDNSLSYVKLDGSVNKVIIDNISSFSGGFTLDLAGNLYITNDDDLKLYKFTPAQLNAAIAGAALSITDGSYVTTLRADGSVAVDAMGRIWSAGFQINGIDLYDPSNGASANFTPGFNNDNYVVSDFSDGANDYISYINASGTDAGSSLTYGYEKSSNLVPEPSSTALLAFGIAGVACRRRRS